MADDPILQKRCPKELLPTHEAPGSHVLSRQPGVRGHTPTNIESNQITPSTGLNNRFYLSMLILELQLRFLKILGEGC